MAGPGDGAAEDGADDPSGFRLWPIALRMTLAAGWTAAASSLKMLEGNGKDRSMLKRRGFVSCALCAAVGLVASSAEAAAQGTSGIKRTILQKTEYPGDKYACILVSVEVEPNANVARHTHPGVESAFLVAGGGTLSVKGQADRLVKAGDGYQIPPETPHGLRNGPEATRLAVTFIVEKDKPLASPAPE